MIATNPIGKREPLTCPSCGDSLANVYEYITTSKRFDAKTGIYLYCGCLESHAECPNCGSNISGLYPFLGSFWARDAEYEDEYEDDVNEEEDDH